MCEECYSEKSRITPLKNPIDCLTNHTQYICGTCGRCICIESDKVRGLQRWNFPFKTIEMAKLYLRSADFTMKKPCGIYRIINKHGESIYKIFSTKDELKLYLKKHHDKKCVAMNPIFFINQYKEYKNTQIKKLSLEQAEKYILERETL